MTKNLAIVKLVASHLTKVYDRKAFYPAKIPGGYPSAITKVSTW